jgi:hypothetical protein
MSTEIKKLSELSDAELDCVSAGNHLNVDATVQEIEQEVEIEQSNAATNVNLSGFSSFSQSNAATVLQSATNVRDVVIG